MMLTRSAAFLGIHRRVVSDLAKYVSAHRYASRDAAVPFGAPVEHESDRPRQYTVENFSKLLVDEEARKKCHLILLEIASLHEDTGRAPSEIRHRDMEDLLDHSIYQRRRYYEYMFKREMTIKHEESRKALARQERESVKRETKEIPDGLFPFIRKQSQFRQLQGKRLMQAALFGQKVVVDFGYSEYMTKREERNLAEQITLAYSLNKSHPSPFDLTFCNVAKDGFMDRQLRSYFQTEHLAQYLLEATDKSYLDLFPKKDLIYLSPDAPQALREWDHSSIFIIGGVVDLGGEKPLSLAKAKEEGIACARFPIREHVVLSVGAQKTLTLNCVLDILLAMKEHNDWRMAFEKLPRRFVADLGHSMAVKRSLRSSKIRKESMADMV